MSVIEDTRDIYQRMVDHFGDEHQINKTVEECGEFVAADARLRNATHGTQKYYTLSSRRNSEAVDAFCTLKKYRLIIGAQLFDSLVKECEEHMESLLANAGGK